jgi:uncharacterized protein YodC (DUF2158 family)
MKRVRQGSIVQIQVGGPPMVVEEILDDWAMCSWFMGDGVRHSLFRMTSLRLCEQLERDPSITVVAAPLFTR